MPPRQYNLSDIILDYQQLMALELPPKRLLLPWLAEGGSALVTAERGIGKTHFALSLATALSKGTPFMRWPIEQATGVLYVDGEMALADIHNRLKAFAPPSAHQSLSILSYEWFYKHFKCGSTMTDPAVQVALLKYLDAHKQLQVVILNFPHTHQDQSEDRYQGMLPFLIHCRRRGVAVILVCPSDQSIGNLDADSRENFFETCIKLTRIDNNPFGTFCCFQLSFTKARSGDSDTITPFLAALKTSLQIATWEIFLIKEIS